jgi:hypothetical protein
VEEVDVHVGPVVTQQIRQTDKGFVLVHVEKEHAHDVAHPLGTGEREGVRRGTEDTAPGHNRYPVDSKHRLSGHCQGIGVTVRLIKDRDSERIQYRTREDRMTVVEESQGREGPWQVPFDQHHGALAIASLLWERDIWMGE